MNQTQIASETQSAILAVFKDHFKGMLGQDSGHRRYATKADKIVGENVIPAEEDAGDWCRHAEVIIYHVNGMPSIDNIEKWGKVSDQLGKSPTWYYVESINSEVSAVYSL